MPRTPDLVGKEESALVSLIRKYESPYTSPRQRMLTKERLLMLNTAIMTDEEYELLNKTLQ